MPGVIKPPVFGIVYKATNKVNGKIYVGITKRTLEKRIQEHIGRSKGDYLFYFQQAIKKYGIESFIFEVIETCYSEEELTSKEVSYIAEYQSFIRENGYNLTYGGDGVSGNPETRKKISESSKGKIITERTRQNMCIAAKKRGVPPKAWARAAEVNTGKRRPAEIIEQIKQTKRGHAVSEETRKIMSQRQKRKAVQRLDLEGNVLDEFESIPDASRVCGLARTTITSSCRYSYIQGGKYRWRYKNEEDRALAGTRGRRSQDKGVIQFDLENNLIAEFSSIREAARKYDLNPTSISRVCTDKQKTAAGFIWRFKNEEDQPK